MVQWMLCKISHNVHYWSDAMKQTVVLSVMLEVPQTYILVSSLEFCVDDKGRTSLEFCVDDKGRTKSYNYDHFRINSESS
jgi:hypothetical protein